MRICLKLLTQKLLRGPGDFFVPLGAILSKPCLPDTYHMCGQPLNQQPPPHVLTLGFGYPSRFLSVSLVLTIELSSFLNELTLPVNLYLYYLPMLHSPKFPWAELLHQEISHPYV